MSEQSRFPELEPFVVQNVTVTGKPLGAGAYGSVEEVEIPGARVAAKKLHPELVNMGTPEQVRKWMSDFVSECKLMSQLRHPHIAQFLGVCYLPESNLPVLLMEMLQTSLDNLLETIPDISLEIKAYLLIGTARGLVYLHSHTPPIAHRDLTARNILVDSVLTAKIADLGVARMVTIQPGQLAATMSRGPGNNLYMPPETVKGERAARYNTAIDTFSFGVVSLFTLTQTFPKDLKPHNYRDPVTRRVLGRTEIECREHYIEQMQAALGETHPLVKLTLDCLAYDPEDRPSAVEVLRRLEEVGKTVFHNCTKTKLELIQLAENSKQLLTRKSNELQQIKMEQQEYVSEKESLILHLQETATQLQVSNTQKDDQLILFQGVIDELNRLCECVQAENSEKQEQVSRLQELTTIQRQGLENQTRKLSELESLVSELESKNNQAQTDCSQKQTCIDRLQAEKVDEEKQIHDLEELRSQQQQQLEDQRKTLAEMDSLNCELRTTNDKLQADCNQKRTLIEELQADKTEKEKQICVLKEQLKDQRKTSKQLTDQLRALDVQPQVEPGAVTATPPLLVPHSISFNWRPCRNRPEGVVAEDTPIILNEKLYVRGINKRNLTLLEYTPNSDQWVALPPPPVKYYSLATLKGQLLLVGGKNNTGQVTNALYTLSDTPEYQYQVYQSKLPTALIFPVVFEYNRHLIVAGGRNTGDSAVCDVNILDTASNQWTTACPLPVADDYNCVLIKHTVYLVAQNSRAVLQARVPALLSSGTESHSNESHSKVWTTLTDTHDHWSSVVAIGNNLLTLGGCVDTSIGKPTSDIRLFNFGSGEWIKVGSLPEPLCTCHCANVAGNLFVVGGNCTQHPESGVRTVYTCKPLLEHSL